LKNDSILKLVEKPVERHFWCVCYCFNVRKCKTRDSRCHYEVYFV